MKKYFVPLVFMLLSCGEHSFFDDVFGNDNNLGMGLSPEDEKNVKEVPQDIKNFGDADADFPKSYLIEDKFPPIQSQGSYGTCVAWSTGYAFKTALNAIEKNWTASDLAKSSNQTSPKDLWLIIPPEKRSCSGGTAFERAMEALITSGVASMADVPYDMANSCDASSSMAKMNPNNKLANYRKIAYNEKLYYSNSDKKEGMDLENFKTYLSQGRPILFAGKLGDNFRRRWGDKTVLYSDYNQSGGHAMVLVGYDDSKGTGGAFKVRNSWGTDWGDNGSIWIDYGFFLNDFCKYAFVAQNSSSPDDPVKPDPPPNPPPSNTYDLLAKFAEDYLDPERPNNPRARAFSYQVYNNGSNKILANQNWGVYYLYYNAFDAEDDYEIIFEDRYTDEYGKPCTKPSDFDNKVCWGKYEYTDALAGGIWNNMNIEPGKKAGEAETGDDMDMEIPYIMPEITGDYYLVVYADFENVIKETNEDNNFYFITADRGKPLKFENGVMISKPINSKVLAKRSKIAPVHSVVDLGAYNAYTPQEIKKLLNRDKKNGVFAKKVAKYREKAHPVKRIKRQ